MSGLPNLHADPGQLDRLDLALVIFFNAVEDYADLADLPFPEGLKVEGLALEERDSMVAIDEGIRGSLHGSS